MIFLRESLFYDWVVVSLAILVGVIVFFKWRFTYWKRHGVKSIEPEIPFGNTRRVFLGKISLAVQVQEFYEKFKESKLRHGGIYMFFTPHYIPVDPELVKNIMQNNFDHFVNHGGYLDEESDPLSGHLFNLEDAKWRYMRAKLTPTFTSGRMKMMFQTLADCTVGLKELVDESASGSKAVDIKEVLGRFTTDIIGSCAFGLDLSSMKDPESEFRKYGKKVFNMSRIQRVKRLLELVLPHAFLRQLKYKKTPTDVEKFFIGAIKDTIDYREKNKIYRKDFVHLLLQLKNRGTVADDGNVNGESGAAEEKALTVNELAAQAFVFFLAGFETSSTTMTFALYELATNSNIQTRVREEIKTILARHQGEITYDAIMEMTYLDHVINETLRKYPPATVIRRRCNKDYLVPETSTVIEKGIHVDIPVYGIHHDPEYYPDPEKFEPDRFTEENKKKRPAFTWIPFGGGPRICIGLRFGVMQSKVGLVALLSNYRVKLHSKMKTPVVIDKISPILSFEGGVWLSMEKIS